MCKLLFRRLDSTSCNSSCLLLLSVLRYGSPKYGIQPFRQCYNMHNFKNSVRTQARRVAMYNVPKSIRPLTPLHASEESVRKTMKQTDVNKQVPAPLTTPFFTQITASLSWLQHSSDETSASHADYTILYTNNCQPLDPDYSKRQSHRNNLPASTEYSFRYTNNCQPLLTTALYIMHDAKATK